MINFDPPLDMVYQVPGTRQVIPYWLYLRILHLFSTSRFTPGSITFAAFVASNVRGDGYEISDFVLDALSRHFRSLPQEEVVKLRNLNAAIMTSRYGENPYTMTNHQMETITPRLTVPGNITGTAFELSDNPTPPLGLPPPANPSTQTELETLINQKLSMHLPDVFTPFYAKHQAGRYESFDLSDTSEHITEFNYGEYISAGESPMTPMDLDTGPALANHLPAAKWPRAPPFGQPHIDTFTGIPFSNDYRPVYNPFFNGVQDAGMDVPLLGDYDTDHEEGIGAHTSDCSSSSKFTEKARSAVNTMRGKMFSVANTEIHPFSRGSAVRIRFGKLGSAADNPPETNSPISISFSETPSLVSRIRDTIRKPQSPRTAASAVSFTRTRRSKSGRLWDRARSRSRSPSKFPKLALDRNSKTLTTTDSQPKTDDLPSTNPDYDPTIGNLLRLQQQGLTFRQIKTLCESEESEDELYAMFWKAVASGETNKLAKYRR